MGTYGQGSVYQRGGTWWIQYYQHGRPFTESAHSDEKRDAVELLNKRLVEKQTRVVSARTPTFELGQAALLADYKLQRRKSKPEERLHNLRPVFAGTDLSTISMTCLRAYAKIGRAHV